MSIEKRKYHSTARQAEAERTKERILAAARELFAREGFDKATIGGVAELAGVSAPSVYALYRSKEGVLRELIQGAAFGPEYQALVDRVLTDAEPIEALRIAARITRVVCEAERATIGLIRGAALLSPALKALEQEGERIRYERQVALVQRLFDGGIVRPELSFDTARDILWSLTSRELYRMMVIERGWSPEAYEQWLAEALTQLLAREGRAPLE